MSYAITVLEEQERQLLEEAKRLDLQATLGPEIRALNTQHLHDVQQALALLRGRSEFVFTDLPIVGVDYDEWKPETYRGITVEVGENVLRFNSGNFDHDAEEVCKKFPAFMERSSVGHYVSDRKKIEQSKRGS